MSPEAGRRSPEDIRGSINNSTSTLQLMKTAEEVLEQIEGREAQRGVTKRKIFKSKEGIIFNSIAGESIGLKVLTIWRFLDVYRGDSITFMVGKDSLGFAGLSYFAEGERKNIVLNEKGLEGSWTVDPQEPLREEEALPKVKEFLHELLDIREKGSEKVAPPRQEN